MKTALVTGANGFVGSHVVSELLDNGYRVVAVGHNGNFSNLSDNENLIKVSCDLQNISALPEMVKGTHVDFFFHFAWDGSAGPKRADYTLQLDNAARACEAVKAAKQMGASRFIGAGSIMEHEAIAACMGEGNRPGTAYIYGSGKLVAHVMASSVAVAEGIDLLWGEITNAYGVGETSPRMVNTTLRKCIAGESPQFTAGTQNYDFIYIDDAARAFRLIAEKGVPFNEYLIGSSTARPLREFLLEMRENVAPDLAFIFGDMPFTGVNMPLSVFDCSKLERDTGFRSQISFGAGCKMTYDWLKERGA